MAVPKRKTSRSNTRSRRANWKAAPVTLTACPRCGQPAGLDSQNPPGRSRAEPYKSHLAYVKERRTDEDGAKILAEALAKLRQRRGE